MERNLIGGNKAFSDLTGLMNQINGENRRAYDDSLIKLLYESEKHIEQEYEQIRIMENKNIINIMTEYLFSFEDLKSSLITELFRKVCMKLTDYVKTDEYFEFLYNDIKKMSEDYGGVLTFYLCPSDMVIKYRFEDCTNIIISEGEDDYIGGYKAIKNGEIINNTYKEKLSKLKKSFSVPFVANTMLRALQAVGE